LAQACMLKLGYVAVTLLPLARGTLEGSPT